jgi:hypothetical protein
VISAGFREQGPAGAALEQQIQQQLCRGTMRLIGPNCLGISEARNLTNDPAFDGWPAWSPDGTKIAFASNRRGSYEIYIMNPDGSGVRKVANNEGRATAPQWTKDGKNIFFPLCRKVDFSFDCQIYAVKLDAFAK